MIEPYFKTSLGRLYLGDCREVLREIEVKPDLIVTDPPYKLRYNGPKYMKGIWKENMKGMLDLEKIGSSMKFEILDYLPQLSDIMEPVNAYFWCSRLQLVELLVYAKVNGFNFDILNWEKRNAPPLYRVGYKQDLEYCVFIRGKHAYWNYKLDGYLYNKCLKSATNKSEHGHPTEKPVGVMLPSVLVSSRPGDLVMDPFGGSGTIAEICEKTGRKWILIEINEGFCKSIRKRIEDVLKSKRMIYSGKGYLFQEAV